MTTVFGYDLETIDTPVRTRLFEIVERISGGAHVVWRDQRQPFYADGIVVKLHLGSMTTHGTPEPRERYDVDAIEGEEIRTDVVEHGGVTLRILVESFDQTLTANALAEIIRRRFYRPWTLAQLKEVNCAVARVEGATDLPVTYDNRVWSAVAFDVRLNVVGVDTQEDFDGDGDETDGQPFIETVSFQPPIEPPPADAIASDYAVVPPPAT